MKRIVTTVALVVSVLLIVAQPAAASWRQEDTAFPGGIFQFTAVSCTSTTTCMAVGNTSSALLAESRSGSTWTIVSIPDPGGGQLSGLVCTSASACEAVGQFTSGGTTETLAEGWNGSSWSIQPTENPSGATSSQLNDLSCKSASSCEAVGQFTSGGATQTLAEVWNGSSWTIQSTPNASGQTNSQLTGVSCVTASLCEAAGSSSTGPNFVTLAEVWNGSAWKIQSTPNGSSSVSELEGVSCTGAKNCWATGRGLAELWDGTNWTLHTIGEPRGNTPADLTRVSCTAVHRCIAVGDFFNKEAIETLVTEQWNGTKWTVLSTPVSAANDSSGLSDVSCTFSTSCVAVGFYHDPVDGNRALAEVWALRWQLQPPPAPSAAIASGLQTISCPVVNFCAAVGGDEESGSVFNAFVDFWHGKSWTLGTVPNASNVVLNSVSCNSKTVCTAVGDVATGGGGLDTATLALRWDGTNWTVQTTPNPSGTSRSFLINVSCPTLKACIAVGRFINGSGDQVPFAEHWNGTTWTIKNTPVPAGAQIPQLNNISCVSSTACEATGSDDTGTWAERWNGTSWSVQTTPTPSGGRNPFLNGISCLAANNCLAVGDFVNSANKQGPLAETWDGTSWTVHNPGRPTGSTSQLQAVSCATNTFQIACNAGGFVTKAGVDQPLGETWNGSSWVRRPVDSPDPNVTRTTFSSVSCPTITNCMGVGFYETSLGADDPLGEQFS
jgi:hypothetical protein